MPETVTRNLPVLALRGVTAFPGQTVSFDVERDPNKTNQRAKLKTGTDKQTAPAS